MAKNMLRLTQKQCLNILLWVIVADIVLGVTCFALGFSLLAARVIEAIWR